MVIRMEGNLKNIAKDCLILTLLAIIIFQHMFFYEKMIFFSQFTIYDSDDEIMKMMTTLPTPEEMKQYDWNQDFSQFE